MRSNVLVFVGVLLMAGCGSAIATRFGFTPWQTVLLAGFALGIALVAQAPVFALRSRLAQLEAKLDGTSNSAV